MRPVDGRPCLAACGIAGPALLALYFGIPMLVPRLGSLLYGSGAPSTSRIVAVGAKYHVLLALGGWLQGTGGLLCVVFFLALVQWSGGVSTLAGQIVLLGCAVLLATVLAEMVFTFTWASAATAGKPVSARAAYDLMARFTGVFPVVPAPAVYLALATVLASGRSVLPAVFARLATALGIAFFVVGLAGVLIPAASAASGGLAGLQDLWILAAAVTVLVTVRGAIEDER